MAVHGNSTHPDPDALTCRDVVELATEHFEGSLPAGTSERFAAHVAWCEGCQSFLRQLRTTADIVHTVVVGEPADSPALMSRFRRWSAAQRTDGDPP